MRSRLCHLFLVIELGEKISDYKSGRNVYGLYRYLKHNLFAIIVIKLNTKYLVIIFLAGVDVRKVILLTFL